MEILVLRLNNTLIKIDSPHKMINKASQNLFIYKMSWMNILF